MMKSLADLDKNSNFYDKEKIFKIIYKFVIMLVKSTKNNILIFAS